MITFDRPEMLFFLFLIPLIIIIHLLSLLYFSKKAFKFANFETIKRLHEKKQIFSKKISQLLIRLIFVVAVVFAASGTGIWLDEEGFTEDIIFAVDSSGSMLADDIEPSRLEATKNALISFVSNSSSSTKARIISFTSVAYLEQFPTYDELALLSAIEDIHVRKSRGTSLGEAINFASVLLGAESDREKAVIIFTDGQENVLSAEELVEIIKEAQEKKIRIYLIGVGSDTGAPIEQEAMGKSVLNEDTFRLITDENEGEYILALNSDEIVNALNSFIKVDIIKRKYELSVWLYMLGFFLLIMEWYLSNYLFRSYP